MTTLRFELPGHPQGKGRARAYRQGNFIKHYTPEQTRSYEGMVRLAAAEAMAGRSPYEGPVELDVLAVFAVPQSFSKRKRAAALGNNLRPTKKPDMDNIIKAISDAMNGVVFKDDCQIVTGFYAKVYGEAPKVAVTVRTLGEEHADRTTAQSGH